VERLNIVSSGRPRLFQCWYKLILRGLAFQLLPMLATGGHLELSTSGACGEIIKTQRECLCRCFARKKLAITHVSHMFPIWRREADYLLHAHVDDESGPIIEQLWAKELSNNRFKICCIPSFTFELALGDIVEAREGIITRVVEPSGRFVYRIWSDDGWDGKFEILLKIEQLGGLMEPCSPHLTAIDAATEQIAEALVEYLAEQEDAGLLTYASGQR
jgi:hypothetical protein